MEYTPIISDSTFTGLRSDVLSGAMGWISVVLVVAGVGLIVSVLRR